MSPSRGSVEALLGSGRHAIWDKRNRKHLFVDHADRGIKHPETDDG
jgi:hypothetical protein